MSFAAVGSQEPSLRTVLREVTVTEATSKDKTGQEELGGEPPGGSPRLWRGTPLLVLNAVPASTPACVSCTRTRASVLSRQVTCP